MKISTINSLALATVAASVLLIPVSVAAFGLAITAAGLTAVMLADYGRTPARIALPVAATVAARRPQFASPYAA